MCKKPSLKGWCAFLWILSISGGYSLSNSLMGRWCLSIFGDRRETLCPGCVCSFVCLSVSTVQKYMIAVACLINLSLSGQILHFQFIGSETFLWAFISVGRSVWHNLQNGWEVTLLWSFRSTCSDPELFWLFLGEDHLFK